MCNFMCLLCLVYYGGEGLRTVLGELRRCQDFPLLEDEDGEAEERSLSF